jgi:hypothetical protein
VCCIAVFSINDNINIANNSFESAQSSTASQLHQQIEIAFTNKFI